MFVGKFNFTKVCSDVFSPAYRGLPANGQPANNQNSQTHHQSPSSSSNNANVKPPAEKTKPGGRERHNARSRRALQDQNSALDRKTSDFADRHGGSKGKKGSSARRRGLSADPTMRSGYQMAVKQKLKVEKISMRRRSLPDREPPGDHAPAHVSSLLIKPRRNPSDHFRTVVQTKVASLNAFKRGIMGKQQAAAGDSTNSSSTTSGILKQSGSSQDTLNGSAKTVTFSQQLPAREQLSEPDLSERGKGGAGGLGSAGSSFDSTRSLSDESILLASSYVCPSPPPSRRDAAAETTPDLLLIGDDGTGLPPPLGGQEEVEALIRLRSELVARIAQSVVRLNLVNERLDAVMMEAVAAAERKSDEKEAASPVKESSPDPWPPLTPEHRRLLRFKSYSYPFLCEDAWYRAGGEDDLLGGAAASAASAADGPFVNGGGLEWEGSVDGGDLDQEEDFSSSKVSWTDFIKLQETCIGGASGGLGGGAGQQEEVL